MMSEQTPGLAARTVRVRPGVLVAFAAVAGLRDVPPAGADARASRDLPDWRRAEFLAARALLRRLLADYVDRAGPAAAGSPILARPSGQPYLQGHPELSISLSHDAGQVAAALGLGLSVGVDVQVPVPAPAALLRRCCRPPVRATLATLPAADRDHEFAWIWTVQESCVKATGQGIAGRPWTVPVLPGARAGRWHGYRWFSLREHSAVPVSVAFGAPPADGSR